MPRSPDNPPGVIRSFAFWLCLFAAAGLYACAALAPRVVDHVALRQEFLKNHRSLAGLEREIERFDRVIAAHQTDPAFAREQVRSDFELAAPDEQRIPVASRLMLDVGAARPDPTPPAAAVPWYALLLQLPARSRTVTNLLLGVAALLVVGGFAFLSDRGFGGGNPSDTIGTTDASDPHAA